MGYLMHDNRVDGGVLFESDTVNCKHCQAAIIVKRGQREVVTPLHVQQNLP